MARKGIGFDKDKTVLAEGAVVLDKKGKLKPVAKKEAPSSRLKLKATKDSVTGKIILSF